MFTNHLVKDIPYLRPFFFDQSFSTLDRRRGTPLLQLMEDKGLEEFERHLLGQSTLMQPKFRSLHDDGSARIIDPFTEQVLPKAALLSLQHIAQRFERPLVGSADRPSATTVVEEGIH